MGGGSISLVVVAEEEEAAVASLPAVSCLSTDDAGVTAPPPLPPMVFGVLTGEGALAAGVIPGVMEVLVEAVPKRAVPPTLDNFAAGVATADDDAEEPSEDDKENEAADVVVLLFDAAPVEAASEDEASPAAPPNTSEDDPPSGAAAPKLNPLPPNPPAMDFNAPLVVVDAGDGAGTLPKLKPVVVVAVAVEDGAAVVVAEVLPKLNPPAAVPSLPPKENPPPPLLEAAVGAEPGTAAEDDALPKLKAILDGFALLLLLACSYLRVWLD